GWGTSRPAWRDNALFGQMIAVAQAGQAEQAWIVQPFDDLFNGVRAYASNLNTHPAYADFRRLRASMRAAGDIPDGFRLARTLLLYSERGSDYVPDVQLMIRSNDLGRLDTAVLDRLSRAQLVVPVS